MVNFFNLSALKNSMQDRPIGNNIYNYFAGATGKLSKSQKEELLNIINENHKSVIEFIETSIQEDIHDNATA